MKKIICLLVALILCLSSAAFAESVPSKTVDDLTRFEVEAENLPAGSGFYIRPVFDDEVEYQERIDICHAEIEKLIDVGDIVAYFGETVDYEGNKINLNEFLEAETLNIFEFHPVIAGGYKEEYGIVTVKMFFPTPYPNDEKVVVMIGIVTIDGDDVRTVDWTAYKGIGLERVNVTAEEQQGCIRVELNPEIVLAIQEGIALVAIVSQ